MDVKQWKTIAVVYGIHIHGYGHTGTGRPHRSYSGIHMPCGLENTPIGTVYTQEAKQNKIKKLLIKNYLFFPVIITYKMKNNK